MSGGASAPLDLSWILPWLAIGGRPGGDEAVAALAGAHGIRWVVDLRIEERDDEPLLRRHGITLLHLPTQDVCAVSQPMLRRGVRWVRRRHAAGERVFIHCQHGIGRSALLCCCVLVSLGQTPSEALALLKDRRPRVSPSPPQLHAILQWARADRARRGAAPFADSWDDLARIAYRHLAQPGAGA